MATIPDWTAEKVNRVLYTNLATTFGRSDWLNKMLGFVFDYLLVDDKLKLTMGVGALEIEVLEHMPTKYTEVLLFLLKEFVQDRDILIKTLPKSAQESNKILISVNGFLYEPDLVSLSDIVR